MERYANEAPSSKGKDNHVDLSEDKKGEEQDDGVASVSSGGSQPSHISRDFKCMSSVDLNSQSGESQQLSERGSGSERSSNSSGSNPVFTKEMYSQLMN
jgi:hypothetical protein